VNTICDLLYAREAQLRQGLDAASSMGDAAYVLQTTLTAVGNEYVADLPVPLARTALEMLSVAQAAAQGIGAVSIIISQEQDDRGRKDQRVIKLFGLLDDLLNSLLKTNAHESPAEAPARLGIDSRSLLDHLAAALDGIDRAMTEVQRMPAPPQAEIPDLRAHPDLIEFLQHLAGDLANHDQATLLKRVERVPSILGDYDIDVETYDPGKVSPSGLQAKELFHFERAHERDGAGCQTLTPALISNGRVVARGRVLIGYDE
jgi:hypothetical protein